MTHYFINNTYLMTNFQTKPTFKKLGDIDIINNNLPWKIAVRPDPNLIKQLFSTCNTFSTHFQPIEDQLNLSYKKQQLLRKSAPLLKYRENCSPETHIKNENKINIRKITTRTSHSQRKISSPSTHRNRQRLKKNKQINLQVKLKSIKLEKPQNSSPSQKKESEFLAKQRKEQKISKNYLKKGENINRQILINLLKSKLTETEDPEEEQILRLLKIYKGSDSVKIRPRRTQMARLENMETQIKNDSLIELKGWNTESRRH